MDIVFDISEDEVPIFLAEVDEHLQVLDDILIRLEKESDDSELVQTVFRSAHTIKGMAGMIGHRRMTEITHALETALDGVRKKSIHISTPLINICLDAVDRLRLLREEVVTGQTSDIDIDELVQSLKDLTIAKKDDGPEPVQPILAKAPGGIDAVEQKLQDLITKGGTVSEISQAQQTRTVQIIATIPADSVASAARAFQMMMALQELGDIQSMTPTQQQIETASAVSDFSAVLVTSQPDKKISAGLLQIFGLGDIYIDGKAILSNGMPVEESAPQIASEPVDPAGKNGNVSTPSAELSRQVPTESTPPSRRSTDVTAKSVVETNGRRSTDMTVRTNVERLDSLMNLVGELITDRNHLQQIRARLEADSRLSGRLEQFSESVTHLGRITDQLQEEVMRIRMMPVGSVFNKFPRMVRDMSQKVGKLIDVVIHGEDTEMDRSMIEEINDPLIHLIRNSVDHGIESPKDRIAAGKPERGTITMTARHEQGRIILTVEDDGGGIDAKRLRNSAVQKGLITPEEAAVLTEEQSIDLMFMAGLSTAQKVTDISGRGVGLDIVNTNIQRVNGSIEVETQLGFGTQFQIVLPLTLAIVPSLLVGVNNSTFAIPLVMITETLRLEKADIKNIYRKPVTLLRGNVLSLLRLSDIFSFAEPEEQKKYLFAVVVHSGKQRVGLIVDSLIGEEEVVVKSLGAFIGDIPGISSAAILGDGKVALIVDVFGLFKLAGI
ncbi:MAG: chemotaxis protein CheA [Chloroflexi bacterium]|nr:chemotaxis protein CheA [Chloroflexota bacterium]